VIHYAYACVTPMPMTPGPRPTPLDNGIRWMSGFQAILVIMRHKFGIQPADLVCFPNYCAQGYQQGHVTQRKDAADARSMNDRVIAGAAHRIRKEKDAKGGRSNAFYGVLTMRSDFF
jgi:hypothetical protein